jgi:predicted membrane protein
MVMRGMNPIVAVFAIIGALVLLGIVLRTLFALIGVIVAVGIVLVAYYFLRGALGKGR